MGRQYPLTMIRIEFPNGDMFDLPLQVIADDCAKHYSSKLSDLGENNQKENSAYNDEYDYIMNNHNEALDWLNNNMDWDDIKEQVRRIVPEYDQGYYKRKFSDTNKEIIQEKE